MRVKNLYANMQLLFLKSTFLHSTSYLDKIAHK